MPKIQDVARLAGVSTATVSKVLSNTPYFSEETRDKVMRAVQELGYRPNLAGRALSSGKTHIVCVVFPYLFDALFKDPLVLSILEGIEDTLTSQNYNLLLSTPRLSEDFLNRHYSQLMVSGYMDGMIAIDSVPNSPITSIAKKHNIPLVVLGYHNAPYQVHSDDFTGGQILMRHLLDLGHRRMGIISVSQDKNIAVNERILGVMSVAQSYGVSLEDLPRFEGDFSTQSGRQIAQDIMTHYPDTTAIVSMNDRMAIGAIQQLQGMGYRVPHDVSVVGYDNLSTGEIISPKLTTVSQHATQLGRKSAEMLLDLLSQKEPSTVVFAPTLVQRESTAKPR